MLKNLSLIISLLLCLSVEASTPNAPTTIVAAAPTSLICNLPAPANLALTGATSSSLDFAWSSVPLSDGYDFSLLKVSTGIEEFTGHTYNEFISIGGLDPNEQYEIRVSSVCASNGEQGGTSVAYGHTDFIVIDDLIVNFNNEYKPFGSTIKLFDDVANSAPKLKFKIDNSPGINSFSEKRTYFDVEKDITPIPTDLFLHHVRVQHENGTESNPAEWLFKSGELTPYCPNRCSVVTRTIVEVWHKKSVQSAHELVAELTINRDYNNPDRNYFTSLTWIPIDPNYEVLIQGEAKGRNPDEDDIAYLYNEELVAIPNPFTDQLWLTASVAPEDQGTVSLLELVSGRVLYRADWQSGKQQHIIPTADLPSGAYVVRLETNKGVQTQKVVKTSQQ
jgi:hypothetical protein